MKRYITTGLCLIALTATGGCSMCCGVFDYDYPTFGGRHERVDRQWGRVGSIYSDPNFGAAGYSEPGTYEGQVISSDGQIISEDILPEPMPPRGQMISPGQGCRDFVPGQVPVESEDILPDPTPAEPDSSTRPRGSDDGTTSTGWRPHPLRSRR